MDELNIAVELVTVAIEKLNIESEEYYRNGDNYRGNIRHDAANKLKFDLERLIIARDYIAIALKK